MHFEKSSAAFICQNCRDINDIRWNKLTADKIPSTNCDRFIMQFITENNVESSKQLTIRLVSSMKSSFKIKQCLSKYRTSENNDIYFQNCTLLVFLRNDSGNDICFFAIYFQLYGNDCSEKPNRNIAYLSYIDSVNLSKMTDRTKTYRMILLGLFKYLKMKKFKEVFIWSCPPRPGLDYIFYEKPPTMKIPTSERLSAWYNEMMKMAQEKGIVSKYVGVEQYAKEHNWQNINNIPLFESDLWPVRLEDAIKEAQRKQAIFLKKMAKDNKKINEVFDLKAKINELLQIQISGFNEKYFILTLNDKEDLCVSKEIESLGCTWINNRHHLIDLLWENKLEFSHIRLAEFSTYIVLYKTFLENKICLNCLQKSEEGIDVSI